MDEGTFVGWLKQDGEPVKAGEPLFTLEGDKASQEVEATESGILRISPTGPKPGEVVSVGALLGELLGAEGQAQPEAATVSPSAPPQGPGEVILPEKGATGMVAVPGEEAAVVDRPIRGAAISPRARRRAAELGVDLSLVRGSGRTGRVVEADVLEAAKATSSAGTLAMRRAIAQRTAESFARAPHFYLSTEIDATQLLEYRERMLPVIQGTTGVRLTLTDLLLRAQALALRDCPGANAIWQEDRAVRLSACDLGLVVGLEDGLLIPIIRESAAGGLAALARQRSSLVEAARARKLAPEEMHGGASSLSNLGTTCVDEFAAVIAPPQSSMLAVGRVLPRPFVVEGQIMARPTLRLCLSADHRVMDGRLAAEFLGRIVAGLEKPDSLA